MKKLFRTLVLTVALGATAIPVKAQFATTPRMKFIPLLSGYNVQISNSSAGYGYSNVLYTTTKGQIVYSYSNNVAGTPGGSSSNSFFGDAFQPAVLATDANGDINANASLWLMFGNTNYIPWVATNSQGLYYIPTTTNGGFATSIAGLPIPFQPWPLASGSGPNWMYPATTNIYGTNLWSPAALLNVTNQFFVSLYASPGVILNGGEESGLQPKVYLGESVPSFTFTFTLTNAIPGSAATLPGGVFGATPFIIQTNLPTTFLQHARYVYMVISATNQQYTVGTNLATELLNMAGIVQPIP